MATQSEINAAAIAVRKQVDATGYGHWVANDLVFSMVKTALAAAEAARAKGAK